MPGHEAMADLMNSRITIVTVYIMDLIPGELTLFGTQRNFNINFIDVINVSFKFDWLGRIIYRYAEFFLYQLNLYELKPCNLFGSFHIFDSKQIFNNRL